MANYILELFHDLPFSHLQHFLKPAFIPSTGVILFLWCRGTSFHAHPSVSDRTLSASLFIGSALRSFLATACGPLMFCCLEKKGLLLKKKRKGKLLPHIALEVAGTYSYLSTNALWNPASRTSINFVDSEVELDLFLLWELTETCH